MDILRRLLLLLKRTTGSLKPEVAAEQEVSEEAIAEGNGAATEAVSEVASVDSVAAGTADLVVDTEAGENGEATGNVDEVAEGAAVATGEEEEETGEALLNDETDQKEQTRRPTKYLIYCQPRVTLLLVAFTSTNIKSLLSCHR